MEHTDVGCSRLVLSEGDCVLSVNTNAGKCGVSLVTHIESRIVAVLYLSLTSDVMTPTLCCDQY